MAKTIELLLTENVEGTGIVGDVVKVRKGFARNYLLPRSMATTPSQEKIKELAGKRADAERQLAELRKQREELIKRLEGQKIEMIRSCNDLGILYGAVTQHEISEALAKAGFAGIKDREVRIGNAIKRVDSYEIHVKFASDLEALVKLDVKPDRKLDLRRDEEEAAAAAPAAEGAAGVEASAGEKKGKDKPSKAEKSEKAEAKAEKPAKGEKKAK
ncbi:MAG: 50S ribosomal protein L9 [Planctomycetaceae bacterium]|jgi:large subunit ribosomal protein L9|nr:50S ribosomal protein L9 [Phycisphaerales bacterium]MCE2652124.1 50S ribosomal protein L9 [Planctomycetaceae bacterium]